VDGPARTEVKVEVQDGAAVGRPAVGERSQTLAGIAAWGKAAVGDEATASDGREGKRSTAEVRGSQRGGAGGGEDSQSGQTGHVGEHKSKPLARSSERVDSPARIEVEVEVRDRTAAGRPALGQRSQTLAGVAAWGKATDRG
jgi:hypothetical protein